MSPVENHHIRSIEAENRELLGALKDTSRILEAVHYTAGLGKGQVERLQRAKGLIAKVGGSNA